MEILWNQSSLNHPPTTTWNLTSTIFPTKSFFKLFHEIYNEINSQNMLNKEAALLSRLIYRMKRKFRHDKGLKNIEKVNRALLKCLRLSLENEYKYLMDNTIINKNLTKLPTKQMLQYVLVRTQGFCMLLCRIEKTSAVAARFFKTRIQLGHAWTISILTYSIISRIWMLSRHMMERCCIWYDNILLFLSQLSKIGVNWLPENYQLPSNLKNWLSISQIEKPIQCLHEYKDSVDTIFNLIEHQDPSDKETDSNVQIVKNSNENVSFNVIVNREILHVSNDVGVRISRDSLALDSKSRSKTLKRQKKNTTTNLISENELHHLLSLDSYPGLDKLQWKIMKKIINKNLLKIHKNTDIKKRDIILKKINKILHMNIDVKRKF